MPVGEVYQTLQTFLGGSYVNQFNRFGRQWRVFLQAEGEDRRRPKTSASSTCATTTGNMVPLSRSSTTAPTFGPRVHERFNLYRAAQITGTPAPGYSSGQAMAALEEVATQDAAARDGLRLDRPLVPGAGGVGQRGARSSACRCCSCS